MSGAAPIDDKITLLIINVKFEHTWVLAVMVWVMLGWFWFKYYLATWHDFGDDFGPPAGSFGIGNNNSRPVVGNLNNALIIKSLGIVPPNLVSNLDRVCIGKSAKGAWLLFPPTNEFTAIELIDLKKYIILAYYFLVIFPKDKRVSDYFAPIILAIFAILLGVINSEWVSNIVDYVVKTLEYLQNIF